MSSSAELTWELDGITMYATVTRPAAEGPFPGVVMVAGSGPTDRDWNSPALPGNNGSARLLAQSLADAGFASLRYDKRASGPHVAENLPSLIGRMSMATHLGELACAVQALADQSFVDPSRLVGLGNSEGTIHLLHYATSPQPVPLAGLILASPPGRPLGEVLHSQLALQLTLTPGSAELLPLVEQASARYSAGEPMNPDPRLPEMVRMVLASFETPANLPFARELWNEDTTSLVPQVQIPTLILIGAKDVQVDARADGQPLQKAAEGCANVTFAFPENANHVLKEDTRTAAEIAAAPGTGYNEPGTRLDPEALDAILNWLAAVAE
ncbi:MAG: alpha/beta hydrolase family protein [Candidatus Nanopelagicales bacterium]